MVNSGGANNSDLRAKLMAAVLVAGLVIWLCTKSAPVDKQAVKEAYEKSSAAMKAQGDVGKPAAPPEKTVVPSAPIKNPTPSVEVVVTPIKKKVSAEPKPTSTPIPDITFSRMGNSKLYAYFFKDSGKEQMKVELFSDLELDSISNFANRVIRCHDPAREAKAFCASLNMTFETKTIGELNNSQAGKLRMGQNPYLGFLYFDNPDQKNTFKISLNPAESFPVGIHLVGGIISQKTPPRPPSKETSVSFPIKDIRFTYTVNDDTEEETRKFQKILKVFSAHKGDSDLTPEKSTP